MRAGSPLELRVPPLAVALIAALLMWMLARRTPRLDGVTHWRLVAAVLLLAVGVLVAVAGVLEFHRAHTTVNPTKPEAASSMVCSGIYRHTRNPMYLGMLFALAAWAVWLASLAAFAVLPAFVLYMNRLQIKPEERVLAGLFASEFAAYRRSVRRWL
ncbi:MAG: isoprenylcysteine carboxylmethyltransferase family protein [Steroidobacteraceae bacterium]